MMLALAVTLAASPATGVAQQSVDLLIRGGMVIDGSESPRHIADIGIRGDRIVFIGNASAAHVTAGHTLEATGLVVAPGFIDPHTHTYDDLLSDHVERRRNAPYLLQGVTTVITGNDGGGPVDVGTQLARLRSRGIGTNVALYVGFGTIRERVLGASSRAPDSTQLARMRAMAAEAMDEGALGLSTGLYYAPQSYASTEEVIAVAREAGTRGGIYDSHLRDESSYSIGLLAAVNEALRIGREAGLPVHIAHIKALGVDVWGMSDSVIALVRGARLRGERVTADQYPYGASGSSVGASLLPRWAEAGGLDSLKRRAADTVNRDRLLTDMRENLRRRGGPHAILLTDAGRPDLRLQRLDAIARARGVEPVVAALDIVLHGDASIASFNMRDDDIDNFMKQDWVFTGSDGSDGHPRKYGTFARKIREYVDARHVLSLEQMVQRSSAAVADALGIAERGHLVPGAFADVIVFDPLQVADSATYDQPQRPSVGMRWVLVNGVLAVDGGKVTRGLAGRALQRRHR